MSTSSTLSLTAFRAQTGFSSAFILFLLEHSLLQLSLVQNVLFIDLDSLNEEAILQALRDFHRLIDSHAHDQLVAEVGNSLFNEIDQIVAGTLKS